MSVKATGRKYLHKAALNAHFTFRLAGIGPRGLRHCRREATEPFAPGHEIYSTPVYGVMKKNMPQHWYQPPESF